MAPGVGKLVVDDQEDAAKKEEDQGENQKKTRERLQLGVVRGPENTKTDEEDDQGLQPIDSKEENHLITFVALSLVT